MIRITRRADYGLMLLCFFVRHRRCWTAGELARESHVPFSMVTKTLKELTQEGILNSHRGVSGGYTLDRNPHDISVEEILSALEGPIALVECVDPRGQCDCQGWCSADLSWQCINRAFQETLRRLTLADMARPIRQLPPYAAVPLDRLWEASGTSGS